MNQHRPHDPAAAATGVLVDRLPPDIAERTVARLESETSATVRIGDPADEVMALNEEVRNEADGIAAGPAIGTGTAAHVRGALFWTAIGAVAGAVIGALIALIPLADLTLGTRMIIFLIVGALAGSTAGFVFGGGRQPEIEGKVRDSSTEVAITVHPADATDAERAEKILAEADLEAGERARKNAKRDEHHAFNRL